MVVEKLKSGCSAYGHGDGGCGVVCRVSKSARSRPRGREGGPMRLRFGVEGLRDAFSWSQDGPPSSVVDLRRFFDMRDSS